MLENYRKRQNYFEAALEAVKGGSTVELLRKECLALLNEINNLQHEANELRRSTEPGFYYQKCCPNCDAYLNERSSLLQTIEEQCKAIDQLLPQHKEEKND